MTYDTPVIRTSPREIVNSFKLKQSKNLIPLTDHYRVSESAPSIASFVASHMHELHKKISDKVAQNNANYMLRANVRNRFKTFNIGDVINKLHAYNAAPFQILDELNDNAYVIDFTINSIFNVEDLVDYNDVDFILLVDELSLEPIFENSSLFSL